MPLPDAARSPDSPTRTEHDSFGPIEVPADRLWGAQTQRSLQHFAISTETMPPELIAALLQVKRAAARANHALAGLDAARADAIVAAADEALAGRWPLEFPLSVWQTGSGTQTNMNVNEVLARRASALLGGNAGAVPSAPGADPQAEAATPRRTAAVHPNDDVNRSQSSNDVFPTAMHVAAVLALERRVLPALRGLCATLTGLAGRHRDLVKVGRTHLQDATPLTLGQEISGWAAQLAACGRALEQALPALRSLAIGGTAVGTGLNAPPGFGQAVCRGLTDDLGTAFTVADNPFAALAGHEAMALAHGVLRTLAAALTKVANDVRWLASGPRAGLGELRIPENEPGSSIMPGKVNPTQCEALTMAAMRVMGNDVVIGMAAAAGNFELNVYKPLIADAFLQSARLMADGIVSFDHHCARGIEPVPGRMAELVERSLMLVTALSPHIGYDRAAKIARQARAQGIGLREAALASGWVAAADYDRWVDPAAMARVGAAAA